MHSFRFQAVLDAELCHTFLLHGVYTSWSPCRCLLFTRQVIPAFNFTWSDVHAA
jgi:hypothetical protein